MDTYKFGEAAKAAGLTEGQLRNWLARYDDLWLPTGREAGKWREFSFRDIVVLGFAVELIRWGAKVPQATEAGLVFLGCYNVSVWDDDAADKFEGPRFVVVLQEDRGAWNVYDEEKDQRVIAAIKGQQGQLSELRIDGRAIIAGCYSRLQVKA
ncbi:MerR family transcriptional regulator [Allopontixanthobacter sp.]|uniref:MerR family transcriptional regulator n=1 Tax=Allopontixanthobacter sp. TaxID=2906452 RepID=UPI002ABCCBDE|nr:MerR family transcriptional regulator [Allopontixanthobacter sp.]MDZ4307366.1 MerR family transcriptional regulator [Allopontixanthobacter sp.]